ncbi:hypothetical protein ACP70R_049303 [Stipagrostis hirtigluma subsp. patula]
MLAGRRKNVEQGVAVGLSGDRLLGAVTARPGTLPAATKRVGVSETILQTQNRMAEANIADVAAAAAAASARPGGNGERHIVRHQARHRASPVRPSCEHVLSYASSAAEADALAAALRSPFVADAVMRAQGRRASRRQCVLVEPSEVLGQFGLPNYPKCPTQIDTENQRVGPLVYCTIFH